VLSFFLFFLPDLDHDSSFFFFFFFLSSSSPIVTRTYSRRARPAKEVPADEVRVVEDSEEELTGFTKPATLSRQSRSHGEEIREENRIGGGGKKRRKHAEVVDLTEDKPREGVEDDSRDCLGETTRGEVVTRDEPRGDLTGQGLDDRPAVEDSVESAVRDDEEANHGATQDLSDMGGPAEGGDTSISTERFTQEPPSSSPLRPTSRRDMPWLSFKSDLSLDLKDDDSQESLGFSPPLPDTVPVDTVPSTEAVRRDTRKEEVNDTEDWENLEPPEIGDEDQHRPGGRSLDFDFGDDEDIDQQHGSNGVSNPGQEDEIDEFEAPASPVFGRRRLPPPPTRRDPSPRRDETPVMEEPAPISVGGDDQDVAMDPETPGRRNLQRKTKAKAKKYLTKLFKGFFPTYEEGKFVSMDEYKTDEPESAFRRLKPVEEYEDTQTPDWDTPLERLDNSARWTPF